jgi:hypothetical protein
LDSPHRPVDSNILMTKEEDSKMYTVADIRPFDELFQHMDNSAIHDKIRQSEFILEDKIRQVFDNPEHNLSPDLLVL